MTAVPNYELEQIMEVMKSQGFAIFDGTSGNSYKDFDLNLVGIRNNNTASDYFDDKYVIFYRLDKKWKIHYLSCTTDPGKPELMHPSFPAAQANGTLIIKHNEQYRGAYTLGYHGTGNWRHIALQQTSPIKAYRDKNRDSILNMDESSVTVGLYGANHHAASLWQDLPNVGLYSAGCQVIQKPSEHRLASGLWIEAAKIWGKQFTYTLLHQSLFSV